VCVEFCCLLRESCFYEKREMQPNRLGYNFGASITPSSIATQKVLIGDVNPGENVLLHLRVPSTSSYEALRIEKADGTTAYSLSVGGTSTNSLSLEGYLDVHYTTPGTTEVPVKVFNQISTANLNQVRNGSILLGQGVGTYAGQISTTPAPTNPASYSSTAAIWDNAFVMGTQTFQKATAVKRSVVLGNFVAPNFTGLDEDTPTQFVQGAAEEMVILGNNSLGSAVTADLNGTTMIGYDILASLTRGRLPDNIIRGRKALFAYNGTSSTASTSELVQDNIFDGNYAGFSANGFGKISSGTVNRSTRYNIFTGPSVLTNTTFGDGVNQVQHNTIGGYKSASDNKSSGITDLYRNTTWGSQTLSSNPALTTMNDNTLIGYGAGSGITSLTSMSGCTALGSTSFNTITNVTSATNCILIGKGATISNSVSGTASNRISIGSGANAQSDNQLVINADTGGTMFMGLGTNNPNYHFDLSTTSKNFLRFTNLIDYFLYSPYSGTNNTTPTARFKSGIRISKLYADSGQTTGREIRPRFTLVPETSSADSDGLAFVAFTIDYETTRNGGGITQEHPGASIIELPFSLLSANQSAYTVITEGAQTINGVKTFSTAPILSTALSVASGGTGSQSFTAKGIVTSGATTTSALTATALTNGQLLIGSTGNAPVAASLSAGTNISVTPGAGSISIATSTAPSFTSLTLTNALTVANGGTGSQSFTAKGVVLSGATTTSALTATALTDGQLIIGSTAGSPTAASLSGGSNITITPGSNSISIATSSTPSFTSLTLTNALTVANGGTGSQTFTAKGVVLSGATTTSALTATALTDGQLIIGSTAGSPTAASLSGGSNITITPGSNSITVATSATPSFTSLTLTNALTVANGGTGSQTFTAKGIVTSGATTTSALTATALTNGQLLIGSTSNAPVAATLTAGSSNITISNGSGSISVDTSTTPTFTSLTLTNALTVANGGTGSQSFTAKGIVTSGATTTSALTATALTNGQLLIGSTSNAPVAATLTGTTNQVNVATGSGTITLSTPQDIGTSSTPTFGALTVNGRISAAFNSSNVVVGPSAGTSLSSGTLNTLVGSNAGNAMTTLQNIIALGANAAQKITLANNTSIGSIFLGNNVFQNATGAGPQIASLDALTTVIAVGHNIATNYGTGTTSGTQGANFNASVFLGNNILTNYLTNPTSTQTTFSVRNIITGHRSLETFTGKPGATDRVVSDNTLYGHGVLFSYASDADVKDNVVMGSQAALNVNAVYTRNVAIGSGASNVNQSFTNCALIGYSVGTSASGAISDSVLVGNNTQATGGVRTFANAIGSGASVTADYTMVLGRFDNTNPIKVVIGDTTSNALLQVGSATTSQTGTGDRFRIYNNSGTQIMQVTNATYNFGQGTVSITGSNATPALGSGTINAASGVISYTNGPASQSVSTNAAQLTITNSFVTTASVILLTASITSGSAYILPVLNAAPGSGSFVVNLFIVNGSMAANTATCKIYFLVC
jgi:hypothetical protein